MKTGDFLRGMGTGLVVGAAIGFAAVPTKKHGKTKGPACRIMKAMGDAVNSITEAMGL